MGLIARLNAIEPETWPHVEAAANQRYWDALALATSLDDHRMGAIYLMGYAVEMLLKTATCRLINVPRNVGIRPSAQVVAGASTKTLHYGIHDTRIAWPGGNFHLLDALASHLINTRASLGKGYGIQFATDLLSNALKVKAHWSESLRYKSTAASDAEMHEVYASVTWFITNYEMLWR